MKQIKYLLVGGILGVMSCLNISCSSDGSNKDEKKLVENMSWSSGTASDAHASNAVALDKTESNTVILAKMQQMSGLRYTEDVASQTQDATWNLCEKSGHEADSLLTATFSSDKCVFNVRVSQMRAKAKLTKTQKLYKFEEGEYIVKVGYSSYEGIKVYCYGVYRADGTLFIPLDGKGCIDYETEYKYTDKQVYDEKVSEYSIATDYVISNHVITFSYIEDGQQKTFEGVLADDGRTINFQENPIVKSVKVIRK